MNLSPILHINFFNQEIVDYILILTNKSIMLYPGISLIHCINILFSLSMQPMNINFKISTFANEVILETDLLT